MLRDTTPQGSLDTTAVFGDSLDYVTVMVGDQMFGLPINRVHDVFMTDRITPVPKAPKEVVGLLNLRGRIVTAICLSARVQRPSPAFDPCGPAPELVAVGIDLDGEAYALIVHAVGEVIRLDKSTFEPTPVHLDKRWASLAAGIHRLEDQLLVVLDVDAVMKINLPVAA